VKLLFLRRAALALLVLSITLNLLLAGASIYWEIDATGFAHDGFKLANYDFFSKLNDKRISLCFVAGPGDRGFRKNICGYDVAALPFRLNLQSYPDDEGIENNVRHRQSVLFLFAAHELMKGDKKLGYELLKEMSFRAGACKFMRLLPGVPTVFEYYDEAQRYMDGEKCNMALLEAPLSRYDRNLREFGGAGPR
jgi:hypothetical protein